MAVCALASARARDGALFSGRYDASLFKEPPSEAFFAAARDVIPKDLTQGKTFDYLRACGVLAITGIQYGDIDVMQQYLGYVHTFVNMRRLYDENNWDRGLTVVGIEERRRFVRNMCKESRAIILTGDSSTGPLTPWKYTLPSYGVE
jgi:hypothetical protein